MYYYDFLIAGLLIRVESRYELKTFYELSDFRQDYRPEKKPDAYYLVQELPRDWNVRGELVFSQRKTAVYQWKGQRHRYFYWRGTEDQYVLLVQQENDPCKGTIFLQEQGRDRLLKDFRLSAFFSMEWLLLNHDAFQLHASVIEWNGKGILFTAPSGTGKSTQAQLWNREEGASIVNGDRGIIRRLGGTYRVYGSPYAGTSGIYVNRSVPVDAIVVLSQGKENRLERLNRVTAFRKLYQEATVTAWDPRFVEEISELLTDLIGQVPVYHLSCRPNADAVKVLKMELEKQHLGADFIKAPAL